MKKYEPIELAVFDKVYIKEDTPHCIKHGAMNKLTRNEDGGGTWRCISAVGIIKVRNGNAVGKKEVDNLCDAGCLEKRIV